jgi:outer membrane protein assembly factor BamB
MKVVRLTALALACVSVSVSAQHWPAWRGPKGDGVSTEANLPLNWDVSRGVAWRVPLAGTGVSAPVVWGDRVFVAGQRGAGIRRPGSHPMLVQGAGAATAGERNLTGAADGPSVTFVIAAHRWDDGAELWTHELEAEGGLPAVHDKHNLASPSPAADADIVVAWYGTGQVVALDHAGTRLWTKHLGREYGEFDIDWGHASSPVLHGDTVFLVSYHPSASYLLALDKRTGDVRWKADRPDGLLSYSTPLVVETPAGAELVVNDSAGIEGVSAESGETRWRVQGDSRFPIPVATVAQGMIYTTRGYRSGPYLAIRLGGAGDITDSHVVWQVPTGAPYVSSLVHYEGLIYTASELGIVTCLDAATGQRVWQQRVGGVFTASPVAGDGKIYLVSETGETIVLRAGRTFEVLARNLLDAHFVASPAIAGGRLFLRADDALFAIGN